MDYMFFGRGMWTTLIMAKRGKWTTLIMAKRGQVDNTYYG
jgi:hypothetical protein